MKARPGQLLRGLYEHSAGPTSKGLLALSPCTLRAWREQDDSVGSAWPIPGGRC